MINLDDIIETVSEMMDNDKIYKKGLMLVYKLAPVEHKKLDEHLFYKAHPEAKEFVHQPVIEVEIGEMKVHFITNDEV